MGKSANQALNKARAVSEIEDFGPLPHGRRTGQIHRGGINMFLGKLATRTALSASVAGIALLIGSPAFAQVDAGGAQPDQATAAPAAEEADEAIVVTGSRIDRAGFVAPTPTTVFGATELRQSAAVNLQQALNDLPQTRNSVSPNQSQANTSAGTAPVELRGLGLSRTLTLTNGRRMVGDSNNLNFVPTNLVQRVEIVTGGASAAWGSGAVAGVVNIILNDDLEGLSLGAQSGVSTRGDGFRYKVDGAFGVKFADGRGHFMIGGEYVNDEGIGISGKSDRPWFGAGLVSVGNGQLERRPDVNDFVAAGQPLTYGGTIITGALAGNAFSQDGTLHRVGPGDFMGLYGDNLIVGSPLKRISSYARASYDLGGAKIWADLAYGRSEVNNQPFLPDPANGALVLSISSNNAFLNPQIKQQLAAAGQTSFLMTRFSRDAFFLTFDGKRENVQGTIGVDGSLGGSWKYSAYYSHGQLKARQLVLNSSIPANLAKAVNAVVGANGQIVCAVNADAITTNDDPACAPFNPFGDGSPSAAARAYTSGTQTSRSVDTLDSAEVEIQGDPFSLWAGPISVAFGANSRWEKRTGQNEAADRAGIFGTPLFQAPVQGKFNVKEAFGEVLVPLVNADAFKLDLNGAARYSDYSLSGGIWSWKIGGTAQIAKAFRLRATRSRDIRAPNLGDLFAVNTLNIRPVADPQASQFAGRPNYSANPNVTVLSGGNSALVPEAAKSWTAGGSFSPDFIPGLDLSVDYYDIQIGKAIDTPTPASVVALCGTGDAEACSRVTRDPTTGTLTQIRATAKNISQLRTSGFDFEAAYRMPLSRLFANASGTLAFRALATRVTKLSNGVLGDVGDTVQNAMPKWRGTFSATYQNEFYTLDTRLRYAGGGKFNSAQKIINNDINARIYVDVGAEFRPTSQFSVFFRVNNLLDRDPPLILTTYNAFYDVVGRYFTAGARVKF
jgi:iron complex outermembrane receptor protein